jgi:hypothetical protein
MKVAKVSKALTTETAIINLQIADQITSSDRQLTVTSKVAYLLLPKYCKLTCKFNAFLQYIAEYGSRNHNVQQKQLSFHTQIEIEYRVISQIKTYDFPVRITGYDVQWSGVILQVSLLHALCIHEPCNSFDIRCNVKSFISRDLPFRILDSSSLPIIPLDHPSIVQ